jgi:hypothetical protein
LDLGGNATKVVQPDRQSFLVEDDDSVSVIQCWEVSMDQQLEVVVWDP